MSIAKYLAKLAQGIDSQGQLSASKVSGSVTIPTISAIAYPGDDTAADPAGGQTITLTGTNFANGAKVLINNVQASVVTVVSSTQITFTAPANTSGSYILYVVNTNGSTAIAVPGIQYSSLPAWTTAAGTLGTLYETAALSTPVTATSDSTVSYSLFAGTLPSGVTINSSTGTISGTSPLTAASTTYTFTIRATDAQLQDGYREFSLTINPDVVTFSSPANGSTVSVQQDQAVVTPLVATSALGSSIVYTSSNLPSGLTISGANIVGAPTAVGSTSSTVTATTVASSRTATTTFTWTVTIAADTYFPLTTLLLNSETVAVPFAADLSTNNFAITAAGDARANSFSPYVPIASSVYFNGNGDYLTSSGNATIATGEFTIEAWVYPTSFNASNTVLDNSIWQTGQNAGYSFQINATGKLVLGGSIGVYNSGSTFITSTSSVVTNRWQHIAITRDSSNVLRCFINGILDATSVTYAATLNYITSNAPITNISRTVGDGASGAYFPGYISNVHAANGAGACKYTTTFTPSVYPIAKTATTVFLACNSNRLVDASNNAFTLTVGGTAAINKISPFLKNPSYDTYGSTYFDGTGDWLNTATNTALALGAGDFTTELWIYPTTTASNQVVFDCRPDGSHGAYAAMLFESGYIRWYVSSATQIQSTSTLALNTWTHVAVTRSSGTTKMYINGVVSGSAWTDSTTYLIGAAGFNIGASTWSAGRGAFTGYISDLRVVKGTAIYTTAFTPPAAPLTAITNTQLLTCQTNQPTNNSMFVDNSTAVNLITRAGNTTQGSFSPYGANWSTYLNGTTDYLTTPYNAAFDVGTADYTMECWFNHTGANFANSPMLFGLATGSASGRSYYFYIDTSGFLNFSVYPDGTTVTRLTATTACTRNVWNHAALVRSSGTTKIYLNGVVVATAANQNFQAYVNGSSVFTIGREAAFNGAYFPGYISNVRVVKGTAVYTTAFTPPTAPLTTVTGTSLLTCQSPNLVDNSLNSFAITPGGTPSAQKFNPFATVTQTPQTHSVYFDGTGDYLTAPNNTAFDFAGGDFTIEFWYYAPDNSTAWYIVGKGDAATVAASSFAWANGGTTWTFYYNSSGTLSITKPSIDVAQWTHIAVVRNGATITIYKNGTSFSTGNIGTGVINTTTSPLYIGGYSNLTPFNGHISNFRVVKGTAVYTANFTPATTPLTAVSGTSLLTCQDATIRDNSTNQFAITAVGDAKPRQQNPFGFTTSSAKDYSTSTFGGSTYFDGTGDYLSIPRNAALVPLASQNFTFEAWVYLTAAPSAAGVQIMGLQEYGSASDWVLQVASDLTPSLWISPTVTTYGSGIAIRLNTWNHIAVVRKNTNTINVYVNGQAGTTHTTTTTLVGGGLYPLTIGADQNGDEVNVTGYIADVRITGEAVYTSNFVPPITPLQPVTSTILLLNGDKAAIADKSGKTVMETVGDARVAVEQPFAGTYYSNYFDGTGDYLDVGTYAAFGFGTGDFTIETWAYPTSSSANQFIYGGRTTNTLFLRFGQNAGTVFQGLQIGRVTTANDTFTAYTFTLNQWYHIAISRQSGTMKVFVNGAQINSFSNTFDYGASGYARIGASESATEPFSGYFSNFRIVKGTAVYTSAFTPPTQPLTAVSGTSLLTCQSNKFLDNSTNAFAITRNGDVAVRTFNPWQRSSGGSMYFDGTGDGLQLPITPQLYLGTTYTIEAWIYNAGGLAYQNIFQLCETNTGGFAALGLGKYGTGIGASVRAATSGTEASIIGGTLVTNTWQHLALSVNAGSARLFLDGTQIGATTTFAEFPIAKTLFAAVGRYANGYTAADTNSWNGYIDDFRITKGYARYTANFTPSTTTLLTK